MGPLAILRQRSDVGTKGRERKREEKRRKGKRQERGEKIRDKRKKEEDISGREEPTGRPPDSEDQ
jgi:hypothetical protein